MEDDNHAVWKGHFESTERSLGLTQTIFTLFEFRKLSFFLATVNSDKARVEDSIHVIVDLVTDNSHWLTDIQNIRKSA